ncbi:MAG: hypothetical protein K0Q94_4368 [Paenibacillus sp.]|jgi:hypothetical protein|nr:hypothetical protein [Paenibacillus sp.]
MCLHVTTGTGLYTGPPEGARTSARYPAAPSFWLKMREIIILQLMLNMISYKYQNKIIIEE